MCKIFLVHFDKEVHEALQRFMSMAESTTQECPLALELMNSMSAPSGTCYKFTEAEISFPNHFKHTRKFHIATRKRLGKS